MEKFHKAAKCATHGIPTAPGYKLVVALHHLACQGESALQYLLDHPDMPLDQLNCSIDPSLPCKRDGLVCVFVL